MSKDEMVVWRCKNGHVMGVVNRNGNGVARLLVYRQALDMEADKPQAPEVMAVVDGMVLDIRCSVCGDMRTWMPGEVALNELVERVLRRRQAQS